MGKVRSGAWAWVVAGAALSSGCDSDAVGPGSRTDYAFAFDTGAQGWVAGFADYPEGREVDFGLTSGIQPLPAPLDAGRNGFHIAGTNGSDDLFMYLARRIDGLVAGARYRVTFEVEFATDAPRGCVGVGGAPGESVFAKAGAASFQPVGHVDAGGDVRLDIDHGQQAQDGAHARTIGDVATSNTDCTDPVFQTKTLSTDQPVEVTAAGDGSVWLIVGTDSGFEGRTSLFYTRIEASLTRAG